MVKAKWHYEGLCAVLRAALALGAAPTPLVDAVPVAFPESARSSVRMVIKIRPKQFLPLPSSPSPQYRSGERSTSSRSPVSSSICASLECCVNLARTAEYITSSLTAVHHAKAEDAAGSGECQSARTSGACARAYSNAWRALLSLRTAYTCGKKKS
jgi:hypothetical protein